MLLWHLNKEETTVLKVTKLILPEVLLLEYSIKEDNRGISNRVFSQKEMKAIGIDTEFVEEICYYPKAKDTLYGIHFQNHPKTQAKLLYCTKGKMLDFAIDLRKDSETYKDWVCVVLSAENKRQLYIPAGFGHAALTLEDNTVIVMKIDNYFDSELSKTISFKDTELNVDFGILNPILSERDKCAPSLKDSGCNL